jgi:HAD superfamily hydrolase (TIGR01509 family)
MTLKAVIFDLDGTLADTEEGHRQAFNVTFKEFGLPWHWDVEHYVELLAVAGGKERLAHYCRRVDPDRMAAADAMTFITRLHERKSRVYERRVEMGHVSTRPGVVRLIRELVESDIRLAIATTTSRTNVDVLLATTLADIPAEWFEVIGSSEQVKHKKPAPDIYRWVIDQLGLPGEACLAIEDSQNGVRAAMGAGIPVLVTENFWTSRDDFTGAVAILPDLGRIDLLNLARWHNLSLISLQSRAA